MGEPAPVECTVELASLSDVGTERGNNEDFTGHSIESPSSVVIGVADGVSSGQAGEVASQMAIEVTLRAFREDSATRTIGKRLYRAVQQANIEVHDKALAVPELRGMATTLTAAAVDAGELTIVHVGDSRLYLIREGTITQLTKDHTAAAERVRYGLLSREKARTHADRSVLTRSLGRELIVSRDLITRGLAQGDVLLLCTDGLYNVLDDAEILRLTEGRAPAEACRYLVEAANDRGTPDNLTAAIVRVTGPTPPREEPKGLINRLLSSITPSR
jgi:protein phosphatase